MAKHLPPPRIEGWRLLRAVRAGDRAGIEALVQRVGEVANGARYFLVEGVDLDMRLLGTQLLASSLRDHGDLVSCAEVASALFRALEHDPEIVHGQQAQRHMVNNVLDLLVYALSHSGQQRRLLMEYPRWLAVAECTAVDSYYPSQLRLSLAEALIHAGEYERAIEVLAEARTRGLNAGQRFEAARLERSLQAFYGRVDEMQREQPTGPELQREVIDTVASQLDALGALQGETGQLLSAAAEALSQGEEAPAQGGAASLDLATLLGAPTPAAGLDAPARLEQLASALWKQRSPLPSLIQCMDLAAGVLTSDGGRDAAVLKALVPSLREIESYADALALWDDRANIKWMRCIALKRLGDFRAAADAHRELRLDIEARRMLIDDPLLRARLGAYLKYLYKSNAEVLFTLGAGCEEELFHVVESAKGKILAEIAGARPGMAARDASQAQLAELEARTLQDLRHALPAAGAATLYVSYLADDDCTYALAVGANGEVRSRRIPIGAATLSNGALELQRLNDGDARAFRPKINPRRVRETSYQPVIDTLSPLIEWLDLEGLELLCLNPPPEVSTVPMHMLQWHGQPLVERVGVVTVPSAELLTASARARALRGDLTKATVFSVPRAGPRGDEERRAFDRIAAAVSTGIPELQTPDARRIDREALAGSDLTNRLVHFSCHGHFDHLNPLKRSGMFIADHGELPTTAEQERFMFTAEDAGALHVSGSHVTLSACVCGRSSQITPGEALGMIWGLLRGRAVSVLGACWNADREATADMMTRFYGLWLGNEGIPKWKALRQAICELKKDGERRSHEYFWAPFVLYGYWD